jgi:hypothetical protein
MVEERIEALEKMVKDLKNEVQKLKVENTDSYIQTITLHCLLHSIHRNTSDYLYTYKTVTLSNVLKMRELYLDALRTKFRDPNLEYNNYLGQGFILSLQRLYAYSIRIVDDNGNIIFNGFETEIKNIFDEACKSGNWSKYPYECLKELVKLVPNIMFDLYVPETVAGKFGMRVEEYVKTL